MTSRTKRYEIIVGNIGTVEQTDSLQIALKTYGEYVRQSASGVGRAGGETVTLLDSDVVKYEHIGDMEDYDL